MCCSTFPTHTRGVVATGRLLISSLLSPLCLFFFFFFRKTCRNCKLSLLSGHAARKGKTEAKYKREKRRQYPSTRRWKGERGKNPIRLFFCSFHETKGRQKRERGKNFTKLFRRRRAFLSVGHGYYLVRDTRNNGEERRKRSEGRLEGGIKKFDPPCCCEVHTHILALPCVLAEERMAGWPKTDTAPLLIPLPFQGLLLSPFYFPSSLPFPRAKNLPSPPSLLRPILLSSSSFLSFSSTQDQQTLPLLLDAKEPPGLFPISEAIS